LQGAASGAGLASLDSRLEDLLNRQPERLVFLHPAWLRTWLSEFGASVEPIVLTSGDGSLLGVAPLMRADDRLTFIGDAAICDFMDLLVDPAHADSAYAALWQQLCAEDWSELELWGLMASSQTRERLKPRAQEGYGICLSRVPPRLTAGNPGRPRATEQKNATSCAADPSPVRERRRSTKVLGTADVVAAMDDFWTSAYAAPGQDRL
jgi:hypothetical protein